MLAKLRALTNYPYARRISHTASTLRIILRERAAAVTKIYNLLVVLKKYAMLAQPTHRRC